MKRAFCILGILILLLSACGPTSTTAPTPTITLSPPLPSPTPTTTPAPMTTPSPPPSSSTVTPEPAHYPDELHLLVGIEGKIRLKRQAWSDYQPTTFGARLRRGDLLLPDGRATVLCADLSLQHVQAESGVPCPVQEPVLWRGKSKVVTPRGPDVLIPYVLHPRSTKVLSPTPLLRWHDAGAGSYTVIVRGGRQEWKQEGVTGSEIQYPTDAPGLKPGVDYMLVVIDEDRKRASTEDPCKGLGFRVFSDEERDQVEARSADIEGLELDEPTREFVLATFYAGQELRSEALVLLDDVSGTLYTPAVHLWRGDLLREVCFPDEAVLAYQVALEQAETLGDKESQAAAHAALWRLMGDEAHLEQAVELYEELGDKGQAETLREEKGK